LTSLAAIVDTHALVRVVIYALVAGVGVTGVFSFGIVGLTRFDEIRRGQRSGRAFAYAALAALATLIVLGAVTEAIVVMVRK
jgi:hypothetical protein